MAIVEFKDVSRVYKNGEHEQRALDHVNLSLEEGKFIVVLGPSGAGKSTLLNMLGGLDSPTEGTIVVNGRDISTLTPNELAEYRAASVGFVFQSYNLIGSMTALENVEFPLVFKRIGTGKRRKMATEMLRNVGLGGRMQHKPKEMSGGQQQRVGIARAFVAKPAIVFADEPTGNLDSKTTLEVMDMLKAMARKNKQTVVMVTHDRKLTEYADKIINILDGKIESIEIQTNSKEGKFPEFEETQSEEKKTGKTSKSGKKDSKGRKTAKEGKNTGKSEQTVPEETPVSGGFNLEYETEKLEAAAQKLIDEEKAAKLAEQGLLEENTGQENDGFAKITQEDENIVS